MTVNTLLSPANRIRFLNKHTAEGNTFALHSHHCCELIYFLSDGEITVEDRRYAVTADTCWLIPPRLQHTEGLPSGGEIVFIGFEGAGEPAFCGLQTRQAGRAFRALFDKILEEYARQQYGYKRAAEALLELLLVAYTRLQGREGDRCKDMDYVKAYLEEYYPQRISFPELAQRSGYSYDYFRCVFKKRFGCSPQQCLINIRLDNARRLLETTRLSCTEIAYRCGFSTAAQMTSMIKRRFGKTPSALRITDSYKNIPKT